MDLSTRAEQILETMEENMGHAFIVEPVQQANGSAAFIPFWNAFRDRDAEEVLHQLDKLIVSYWLPMAQREAEASEVEETNDARYRRVGGWV